MTRGLTLVLDVCATLVAVAEPAATGRREVNLMGDKDDAEQDLYVAAYSNPSTAEEDWNALKQLAADDVIKVEALALVNRDRRREDPRQGHHE